MTSPALEAYKPLEAIRENERFAVYKGHSPSGKAVLVKLAIDEALWPRIENEAESQPAMRRLDPTCLVYRTPPLIEQGPGYLVREWVDGTPMSDEFQPTRMRRVSMYLAQLAQLYAHIDKASQGPAGITYYNQPGREPAPTRILRTLIERGQATHYFDEQLLEDVMLQASASLATTPTCYTNGDLQPANLLLTPGHDPIPVQIDFESCSALWPRHYNIVNFTLKYGAKFSWLRPGLQEMFTKYCIKTETDSRADPSAFNLSAAMRCLEMIHEKTRGDQPLDPAAKDYLTVVMERIRDGQLYMGQRHGKYYETADLLADLRKWQV